MTMRVPAPVLPCFAAVFTVLPVLGQSDGPKRISFKDLKNRAAKYSVSSPSARWVADGMLLEVRDPNRKKRGRVVLDPRTWREAEAPKRDSKVARDAVDRLSRSRVRVDRGSGQVLFTAAGSKAVALTKDAERKREAHLSPKATHASYVRGNNLVICDVTTREEWSVTTDGGPEQFHGVLDWVYQEEVYGRGDFQAHWWSPSGDHVAFISLDESPVKEFTLVDHVPSSRLESERAVETEVSNYPKAGDPNPFARMSVADIRGRSVATVNLERFPKDALIVSVGWTPGGDKVVFQIQNRIQTWLELCYADPSSGAVTTLIREESPTWVNVLGEPRWLDDGTFLWWSERTGYKHLYHYDAAGKQIAQVTQGEFPVRRIVKLDAARKLMWFTASPEFPADAHAFRVRLDGQEQTQLTSGRGSHRISLNHDGSMFVDTLSSVTLPPQLRVCDGDGEVLRTVQSGGMSKTHAYCQKELHVVEARDGYPLEATVIKPLGFREDGGPYPVWIETYSGPAAPSVRNSWRVSSWQQFLAHQGIIVLQVNVRTASAAGQKVVGECYKQFCVQELRDMEDTVKWLTANSWADQDRVGITGWSYGGSMTAYALTHSKLFRVGIAGAGVYDWQLYDTIYTERYMDTPQNNPKGYQRSSCIEAAKNLNGYLVLLHGTMDDNVHMQNTIRFAHALQRAGKDFELMLYAKSRHGVRDRKLSAHMQQLRWKIIQRELIGERG